jgi:FkbM family methyltransferase
MIVAFAKSVVKKALPEATIYKLKNRLAARHERLLSEVLPLLAGGIAVDIGASEGVYCSAFARRARRTLAFEPNPVDAERLIRFGSGIEVHTCALSNTKGQLILHIPFLDGKAVLSRSSLNPDANPGFTIRTYNVPAQRLDDFSLTDVRVIKIDVEGHERLTLKGAEETIRRWRPALIIEIEERHHPGDSWPIIRWIEGLGYKGFFAAANGLQNVEQFDFATMQNPNNLKAPNGQWLAPYVNNFLFLPH